MKTPTGYVALRKGRHVRNCIFLHWLDAEEHITDYDEAEYSIIDSFQDAEKYIISNANNKKCSPLEGFAVVATSTSHDQTTLADNTTHKCTNAKPTAPSLLPPPLLPATIDDDDINDDNDVPNTTTTASPDSKNNDTKQQPLNESKDQQPSTATKVTATTASIPVQPTVKPNQSTTTTTNDKNKNQKRKRSIETSITDQHQQNKKSKKALPVKVLAGTNNSSNKKVTPNSVSRNATTPKTTPVQTTPAAAAANNDTSSKATTTTTPSSSEILVRITGPNQTPTVVWSDATKSINSRWKKSFENFLSYRNIDGTFPHPIPDDNVRKWFSKQRIEYKNKIQGKKNTFCDEKEKIFRTVGVVFFSVEGFFKLPEPTKPKTPTSTTPVVTVADNNNKQQQQQQGENNQQQAGDTSTIENTRPKKRGRKPSSKTHEKKKKQEEINFNIWKDNLEKLKEYMDTHDGDWMVKSSDDENLSHWVSLQKTLFLRRKKGESTYLNDEKITMLRDIGVELDKVVYTWKERIEQLQQYKQEHGNLQIPYNHPKLGVWTQSLIRQYRRLGMPKQRKLSTECINELNQYGVNFLNEVKSRHYQMWNYDYDIYITKLKEYKEKYDTCCVKSTNEEYTDLHSWYGKVQNEYRKLSRSKKKADTCRLSMQQMAQLTQMGFPFKEPRDPPKTFEESIELLKEYKRNGGDVSKITRSHPELGDFVGRQRKDYRLWCQGEHTVLTEERIKILEDLGFTWNVEYWVKPGEKNKIKSWDERYQDLLNYKAKHGHVMVPMYEEGGLGHWVKNQRRYYKLMQNGLGDGYGRSKPRITTEQALKLSNIGFIFNATSYRKNRNSNSKQQQKNDNNDDDDNNNNSDDYDYDYE